MNGICTGGGFGGGETGKQVGRDVDSALGDGAVPGGGLNDVTDGLGELNGEMIDVKAGGTGKQGGDLGDGGGVGEGKMGGEMLDDPLALGFESDGAGGEYDFTVDDGAELVDFEFSQGGGFDFAFGQETLVDGETLTKDGAEPVN